jgi:hypothetical protein
MTAPSAPKITTPNFQQTISPLRRADVNPVITRRRGLLTRCRSRCDRSAALAHECRHLTILRREFGETACMWGVLDTARARLSDATSAAEKLCSTCVDRAFKAAGLRCITPKRAEAIGPSQHQLPLFASNAAHRFSTDRWWLRSTPRPRHLSMGHCRETRCGGVAKRCTETRASRNLATRRGAGDTGGIRLSEERVWRSPRVNTPDPSEEAVGSI